MNSVFENITDGEIYDYDFLVENCPEDKKYDLDYVMSLLDWEKNVDPHYRKNFFREPIVIEQNEKYTGKVDCLRKRLYCRQRINGAAGRRGYHSG